MDDVVEPGLGRLPGLERGWHGAELGGAGHLHVQPGHRRGAAAVDPSPVGHDEALEGPVPLQHPVHCYYHYWFKGKQLLERPFEHVLKTKELTLPFCLSWANQSWTRTWYGQATTVLVAQEYGDRIDWERHFEYLLPAFKDERYITVDDRPLFIIHDSADIPDCADRLTFWNDLARRNGLKGLYFVQTLGGFPLDVRPLPIDAHLQFEPGYTMVHGMPAVWNRLNWVKGMTKHYLRKVGFIDKRVQSFFDYDMMCSLIVRRQHTPFSKPTWAFLRTGITAPVASTAPRSSAEALRKSSGLTLRPRFAVSRKLEALSFCL